MCRLPRRSSGLLRRRKCGLPAVHVRDFGCPAYCGCAQSFWPGSWTYCHLQSARPISSKTKRTETLASMVRASGSDTEKGSGELYGGLLCLPFTPHALGRQPRTSAQFDGGLRAPLLTHAASDG